MRISWNLSRQKSTCKKTSEGFVEAVYSTIGKSQCGCEVLSLQGLEESGSGVGKKKNRKEECFEGKDQSGFDVLSLR